MKLRLRLPAASIVGLYIVVSLLTLVVWSARGVYPFAGDEPHYLVIGDALWRFGGLDVAAAYQAELVQRAFYPPGLGELNDPITVYGHVVPGERGVFSWHGYLLGWIVGIPSALFGPEAARGAMVVLGSGIAYVVWRVTGEFFAERRIRVAVAAVLVLTYPFLLASTQIFPDFVAGGLVLLGVAWLMAAARTRVVGAVTVISAVLVSTLPWFGIKFAPIAAVLLLAMAWRSRPAWWLVLGPGALSGVLFAGFNYYAYGSPFGSLTGGTVEFGGDFWIRLAGMIVDQNQGALLFNPLLWLGLVGLVPFLRRDRLVGTVWSASFLLLWVLGAAHPGWYGGGSFIGRYSWGLALLLMLPAMVTLAWLRSRSPRWFVAALAASLAFSAWVFTLGVFVGGAGPDVPLGLDFFTKPIDTWLDSYSVLWFPIQGFLGAFYNPDWSWLFLVNYVWIGLAVVAIGVGWLGALRIRLRGLLPLGGLAALAGIAIVGVGLISVPGDRSVVQIQEVQVEPGTQPPGTVAGGPVWLMRDGPYTWAVEYATDLPEVDVAGRWEIVRAMDESVVAAGELPGTNGQVAIIERKVPWRSLSPRQFYLRVVWSGQGTMAVDSTGVRHE